MNNYLIDGVSNNDCYYGDSLIGQAGVVGIPATYPEIWLTVKGNAVITPPDFGSFGTMGHNVFGSSCLRCSATPNPSPPYSFLTTASTFPATQCH